MKEEKKRKRKGRGRDQAKGKTARMDALLLQAPSSVEEKTKKPHSLPFHSRSVVVVVVVAYIYP